MSAARAEADALSEDPLSRHLASVAVAMETTEDPEARALATIFLPLLNRAEAAWTAAGREPVPVPDRR